MGSDKKWIYLSYIGITLIFAWVLNRALLLVFTYLRLANPTIGVLPMTNMISIGVMTLAAFIYFRQEKVQAYSFDVLQEMKKVTWPKRKNAYMSTIVVLVATLIFSIFLGLMDWLFVGLIGYILSV